MKFLVTDECVRLARWLRLMGHDTALMPARPLSALYSTAYEQSRTIITRTQRVRHSRLFRVVPLEKGTLEAQLRQLIREVPLTVEPARMLSRCDRCNVSVEPIEKSLARAEVPPYVFETQSTFHRCPTCHRIYWSATHEQRIRACFSRLMP
jgi:uncharacterized protein with PIN domain